ASASWLSGTTAASTATRPPTRAVLRAGTARWLTWDSTRGISPSRDIDTRIRVCPYSTVSTTEAIAITAPAASTTAGHSELVTRRSAVVREASESPRTFGPTAPVAANATSTYTAVTMANDRM